MIRPIGEQELLKHFYKLAAEVECGSYFDFSNPNHDKWLRRRISRHYYRGMEFYALFLDDDTPVGFAALLIDEPLQNAAIFGQMTGLLDIGINNEFRGKGYGKELLKYAERKSADSGAYCMYVSTYEGNQTAIAFYESNGFEPIATLPDVNGPGNEGDIYLRKILK